MRQNKITAILVVSFIFILFLNLHYPKKIETNFLTVILSISTFLFGIFISFSIADRHGRITEFRDNDSIERGALISIYKYSAFFGKEYQVGMAKLIDEYLMTSLDYRINDYHKNEKYLDLIYSKIQSADIDEDEKGKIVYSSLLGFYSKIVEARRKTIALIADKLSKFEWLVAFFLPFIILLSSIMIETNSFIVAIISSILSVMIINITLFLYSLDSMSWKEEKRIFEPYQQTFEAIDKHRYYPEDLINEKRVKHHKGNVYRVGRFNNRVYPDFSQKKIDIIDESKKARK